jgi:hypothetical protein
MTTCKGFPTPPWRRWSPPLVPRLALPGQGEEEKIFQTTGGRASWWVHRAWELARLSSILPVPSFHCWWITLCHYCPKSALASNDFVPTLQQQQQQQQSTLTSLCWIANVAAWGLPHICKLISRHLGLQMGREILPLHCFLVLGVTYTIREHLKQHDVLYIMSLTICSYGIML